MYAKYRGALDLARHTTAVTLKHYFSDKPTPSCTIPCDKCGVYFPSDEFLIMHREKSTCGASGSKLEVSKPTSLSLGISSSDKKSGIIHDDIEDAKSPSSKTTVVKRQSPRNVTLQQKSNPTSSKTSNEKLITIDVDISITKSKDNMSSEKNLESHSTHTGFNDSLQSDNVVSKKRFSSIEELANFQKMQKKSNLSIVPEGNLTR